jgi:hypothetical protein
MPPELGFVEFAIGLAIFVGIFVAFMAWAVLPLAPFLLIGAVYAGVRHGVPALARGLAWAGRELAAGVRWVLRPVAHWALGVTEPVAVRGGAGRR